MTDWGYAAGWLTVRAMPEFAARNAFDAGALYASRNGGPDQLRKNLARVIGVAPKDVPGSLMRASLASYARYWREAFRLPTMDHHAIGQRLAETVAGQEHVDAALADGRGAVAALPHSGNWDMAGVWMAQTYGRFTTVAERLKPESLYRRFIDYRESLGFEVIPLSGGEQPPFPLLSQRLRGQQGGVSDGRAGPQPHRRPGRLLRRTDQNAGRPGEAGDHHRRGAAAGALLVRRDDCRVEFYPPMDCSSGDVGVVTQALADVFARNIAEHPADWHMLQPQWLADLSQERQARLGIRRAGAQRPGDQGPV